MSSSQYAQEAVKNVEQYLKEHDMKLPAKANTPLTINYCLELDVSPELDPERANYYCTCLSSVSYIGP